MDISVSTSCRGERQGRGGSPARHWWGPGSQAGPPWMYLRLHTNVSGPAGREALLPGRRSAWAGVRTSHLPHTAAAGRHTAARAALTCCRGRGRRALRRRGGTPRQAAARHTLCPRPAAAGQAACADALPASSGCVAKSSDQKSSLASTLTSCPTSSSVGLHAARQRQALAGVSGRCGDRPCARGTLCFLSSRGPSSSARAGAHLALPASPVVPARLRPLAAVPLLLVQALQLGDKGRKPWLGGTQVHAVAWGCKGGERRLGQGAAGTGWWRNAGWWVCPPTAVPPKRLPATAHRG